MNTDESNKSRPEPQAAGETIANADPASLEPRRSWGRVIFMAGLVVLGIAPWAQAQLPPPSLPAFCPPLTAFASPTFFDYFWGTTPIRFPYQ